MSRNLNFQYYFIFIIYLFQIILPILGNENSSRDEPFDLTFDFKSQKSGRLIKISGINLLKHEEITISGNVIMEIFKSDIKVATNINSISYIFWQRNFERN